MKPRSYFFSILFALILLATGLACNFVTGIFVEEPEPLYLEEPAPIEPTVEVESQPESPLDEPTISDITTCSAVTEEILKTATEFDEDFPDDKSGNEPEELYLVTYSVSGDQLSDPIYYEDVSADLIPYQEDQAGHQEIWDYFTALIPANERGALAEYSIVTDGKGEILAAVTQTLYDPKLWGLEVDIRDADDRHDLTYTLIHEYAHLLTLGPEQVTPSEALFHNPDDDNIFYDEVTACPNYFPGEGCSSSSSYINAFFDEFWADIYEEWLDINLIEDDDTYYDALDDFYYNYEDRFVTDYAATNPEEDIAETFSFFVLLSHPDGDTVAEKKILYLYNYPELVQLRDEIIHGICNLNQ
ncbi:MAG: hypothetical protein PVJ21_19340 [Anaerolineales bacterium]|jgi:hypothetical protein